MQMFSDKRKGHWQANSAAPASSRVGCGGNLASSLDPPRRISDQAVQNRIQSNAGESHCIFSRNRKPQFSHDFTRISVNVPAVARVQPKMARAQRGGGYKREADRVAE